MISPDLRDFINRHKPIEKLNNNNNNNNDNNNNNNNNKKMEYLKWNKPGHLIYVELNFNANML